MSTPWTLALEEQVRANERSWEYRSSFLPHRTELTRHALALAPGDGSTPRNRLCVLGAGNGADIDLEALTRAYEEVHLVDWDGQALRRARQELDDASRARVVLHPNVDLSGLGERIDRWRALRTSPEELMEYPERTAQALAQRLPGPFDAVVSSCLLSQMHLELRRALGEAHPLFGAAGYCLNLAHLRTLLELLAPGGRSLLCTDVATSDMTSLDVQNDAALALLERLEREGTVFHFVAPGLLRAIAQDDPPLRARARVSAPRSAWLWQNGPRRRFLVYAVELDRVDLPSR